MKNNLLKIGLFLTILTGCKSERVDPKPAQTPPPTPTTTQDISFQKEVLPILNRNCAASNCHYGAVPAADFSLEDTKAYNSILNRRLVNTTLPDSSKIIVRMKSTDNPMPPYGNIDDTSIEIIYKWVQQGAKDN